METWFMLLVLLALAGSILLSALTLHKVRRIHIASYAIASDAREARRETSVLFAQLQALLSLKRTLSLSKALPSLRGWAGSPDFLLHVAEHVLESKPTTVVECSSGASTLIIARCLQLNGAGHVFSLEHDHLYAERTRAMLHRHCVDEFATVIVAPLEKGDDGIPWYRDQALPPELPPIDLLVVDGPPGTGAPMARYPALPRLKPNAAASFTVMLDDASRPDELAIVQRWLAEFPDLVAVDAPACEKGISVLQVRNASKKQSAIEEGTRQ